MAKEKSTLGKLVKLGAVAAAAVTVYNRREELRGLYEEVKARYDAMHEEHETPEEWGCEEENSACVEEE